MSYNLISKKEIEDAHLRIIPYINQTPIMSSQQINNIFGCEILFKCENFQKVGAFKTRGAVNAVFSLDQEQKKYGVCTHSSGNHAQALARAASLANITAHIVMPNNAPKVKVAAVKDYGGKIYFCEPSQDAREELLKEVMEETKATFIHPYDKLEIIAGQATAAKELINSVSDLDMIIAPVGGGGLLSGTALSNYYFSKNSLVIGAEPKNADDAFRSFNSGEFVSAGNPKTLADGLLTSLGDFTFPIIKEYVDKIFTCSEENIVKSMQLIYERMKIVVEPSSAVALAIIMENPDFFRNKKLGIIISGGNVDLEGFFNTFET